MSALSQLHLLQHPSAYILKIGNIPSDLSEREARLIFSLVIDDIISIQIKNSTIYANFNNYDTCITTGKLLNNKYIFGKNNMPIIVEFPNVSNNNHARSRFYPFNDPFTESNINNQPQQQQQQPPPSSNFFSSQIPQSSTTTNGPTAAGLRAVISPDNFTNGQSSSTSPTSTTHHSPSSKDIPELSLLAKVPPPSNPADQNPPCNTLYVGNLPPDATEVELRTLFQDQKGFRRLSFRNKDKSSPMCFVEFEDVAHATIALAQLYGTHLSQHNAGKGGIRLSFSKNPLGVRRSK